MNASTMKNHNILLIIVILSFTPSSLISNITHGSLVRSQMISAEGSKTESRKTNEIKIRRFLENKLVAEKLNNYGLST
jgi:hypothetical protein